jgi:hypothetical protein
MPAAKSAAPSTYINWRRLSQVISCFARIAPRTLIRLGSFAPLAPPIRLLSPLPSTGLNGRDVPMSEVTGLHSISSSARLSMEGGTVRPMSLAAFRLMRSSNLVG